MTCSKLDAPKYGKVWVTGNSYSSTAYYTCNYGYDLDGVYSRKCQHDGRWGGKAPECRPVKRGKHDYYSSIHNFYLILLYTCTFHSYLSQAYCTKVWQGLCVRLRLFFNSILQLWLWIWPGWLTLKKMPAWWYMVWKGSRMPSSKEK